jgi:hypothetical protein
MVEGGSDEPISIQAVPKDPDAGRPTAFSAVKLTDEQGATAVAEGVYYTLHEEELHSSFFSVVREEQIAEGVWLVTFEADVENLAGYTLYDVSLPIQFFSTYGSSSPERAFSYDNNDHTWYLDHRWARTHGAGGQNTLLSMDRSVTDVPLTDEYEGAHMSLLETDEVALIRFGDLLPGELIRARLYVLKDAFGGYRWTGSMVSRNPHRAVTPIDIEIAGPNAVPTNSWARYAAITHFENNISSDSTDRARWWVEPDGLATIYGGCLVTPDTNAPQQITVYAEYVEAGTMLQAQIPVTVYPREEDAILRVPLEYPTIQAAIDAADHGDAVVISPGTYTGPGNRDIDFRGKAISVRSENPADHEGVASTIIDCNGSPTDNHTGFVFANYEDSNSVLAGLTITNGYAHIGAGINCGGASPTVADCVFRANTALADGGAAYTGSMTSSPVFSNCTFVQNRALGGDGGAVCYYTADSPIMFDCTFLGNSAADGGGALAYQRGLFGSAVLADCTFNGNSGSGGGALADYARGPGGILDIIDCRFTNNLAIGSGGAVDSQTVLLNLANCILSGNSAQVSGGGINNRGNISMTNCALRQNLAAQYGGGMASANCEIDIVDCVFSENSADQYGGGMASNGDNVRVTNSLFVGNSASQDGGAISSKQSFLDLTNCTITGNRASEGRALCCDLGLQCTWEPWPWPPGVHWVCPTWSNIEATNCILRDGGDEVSKHVSSTVTITHSDVQDGYDGEGNIDADPCFAFPTDCHLMPDSPCVDRGTNAPAGGLATTDMEGTTRMLDGDGDGNSVVDMGAYEYNPNSPSIAVSGRTFQLIKEHTDRVQSLWIRNCGAGTLNWQIIEDCNWIEVWPTSGISVGDVNHVNLTADFNGLSGGRYQCTFAVTDPDAANNQVTIEVSLHVPGPLYVPDEYATIQAAIDAARDYDTVVIEPGTYTGDGNRDLDFRGKPITVRSIDPNDPNIVAATIIDCNGTCEEPHRGFYFHTREDANSIIDGLTITNGFAPGQTRPAPVYPPWWPDQLKPRCTPGPPDEPPEWPPWMDDLPDANLDDTPLESGGQEVAIEYTTAQSSSDYSYGGAIFCEQPISYELAPGPTVRNSVIRRNASGYAGGGICGSSGPIVNCKIYGNVTIDDGGGLCSCTGPIINCIIGFNSGLNGGGLASCGGPIDNCTITDNWARRGAGIYHVESSDLMVSNCILWRNRGGQVYLGAPDIWRPFSDTNSSVEPLYFPQAPSLTIDYSDVEDGNAGIQVESGCTTYYGQNNIDADPLFGEPGYWGDANDPNTVVELDDPNAVWVEGDYHLMRTSPCIDAADNNSIAADVGDLDGDDNTTEPTPWDFEGKPRIIDGIPDEIPIVDMGAYETITEPLTHYVDGDANGANDGSSWEDAFKYLQEAPAGAIYGDQIWVAEGTYRPDESPAHRDGTGERTATFQLKNGIIIRGGFAGAGAPDPDARDFGIYETVLSGDLDGDDGAGFANNGENSYHVVSANSTDQTTVLEGLTITAGNANDRRAGYYHGGGILIQNGSLTVSNCRLQSNYGMKGGAVASLSSSPNFVSCLFSGNHAVGGGAMLSQNGSPSLINCTVTGNSANTAGGILSYDTGRPILTSCVFRQNRDTSGTTEPAQIAGTAPFIDYCCVQGWTGSLGGIGNMDADPCFVEPGYWDSSALWHEGDYHLPPDSPCIDAGDPCYASGPGETDLDGKPRVIAGCVDMGVYEVSLPAIQCRMRLTPRKLNLNSKGNWVKAHFVLPKGLTTDDVDTDSPFVIEPLAIESAYVRVTGNRRAKLQVGFERSAFCRVRGFGPATVTVTGRLISGQYIYGTDTITLISHTFNCLADFADYWLRADCASPDWCNGADLNQDSAVDFADFARFDYCCMEITMP